MYNCLFDGSHSQPLRRFFAEDEEMLRFIFARYPDQTWLHCKDKDGSFQRIFNTLFEENSVKRSDSNDMMQAELVKLLLLIRRSKENDMAVESGASKFGEDALESVLNLLRRDPVKAVRMRDLAAMAGFSERQFRRQFAACTGMSYTDYVNKLRVEICCDLLLATNEKIAAIARLAGYEDMKHFNRLFKRITGQTPRQIRSMHAARGGVDGQKETRG
ncbi:helix-turn-helix domain-containing protein [Cohnella rhizosphaerae]|uniref:AraC family transcriptional regulator n=1 Tax=Cohnella rhizosphaerae TaxID=1457232 RepID=A0A9X4QRA3_9BACL|nr:AraC family transcriptional regulator [Cohnella rhizosphaerae]MDG0808034.1 AraC family transcriptional regulator [Cohnella rhizosphaerae]